jgi:hypothetical protein
MLKKNTFYSFLAIAFAVTGCGGSAPVAPTSTPLSDPAPLIASGPTPTTAPTTTPPTNNVTIPPPSPTPATPTTTALPVITSVSDPTVTEGTKASFAISLNFATSQLTTFKVTLADGTAKSGVDYSSTLEYSDNGGTTYHATASGGIASVKAGTSIFLVRATTLVDPNVTPTKNFTLSLSPLSGVAGGQGRGVGQIIDASLPAPATVPAPATAPEPTIAANGVLPQNIANGSTVLLDCGIQYRGTLNLESKTNVTVKVNGTCGKAEINPAVEIKNWTPYSGNIYVADVAFETRQVIVNGRPLDLAHYPNRDAAGNMFRTITNNSGSTGLTASNLNIGGNSLVGAGIKIRNSQYLIEESKVANYDPASNSITLSAPADLPIGWGFYLDGKLWMLDQPGEWAQENGKLYVWMPDGKAPTSVDATPASTMGINAYHSTGVSLDGITVMNGEVGIDASSTIGFSFRNGSINNSYNAALDYEGSNGAIMDNLVISTSGLAGIRGGGNNATLTNNTVRDTGVSGNPRSSRVGIALGPNGTARNNTIVDSAYIGMVVQSNSLLEGNIIDGACLILDDCGGIYTSGVWGIPSGVVGATYSRIINNTVRRVTGNINGKPASIHASSHGVYLDDFASWVTISGNTITNTVNAMQIHNGHDNIIENNRFDSSIRSHIFFSQSLQNSSYSIYGNIFRNNVMGTSQGYVYALWSDTPGDVTKFGTYSGNTYSAAQKDNFAEVTGYGVLSWTRWPQVMSDTGSTLR